VNPTPAPALLSESPPPPERGGTAPTPVALTPTAMSPLAPTPLALPSTALTPATRLVVVGAICLTLILMAIGCLPGLQPLRGWSTAIFLLVEVGASPWLVRARPSGLWFALLSLATSLGGTVAVGFLMAATHLWHPAIAISLVVLATVVLLAFSVRRDYRLVARSSWTPRLVALVRSPAFRVAFVTVVGLLLVIVSLSAQAPDPQRAGLFASVGFGWYLGVLVLIAALVFAFHSRSSIALPVLALSAIVVLSQAIVYGSPAVMSAARHVGVVDYIRVNHGIHESLDIYQAWSGLFAGIAWVCDVGGIRDAMTVATWWPVLLSAGTALAVAGLASRWITGRRRIWFAALVFVLTSTLDIIYFSPQSLGFFFAIVIVALATTPRRSADDAPRPDGRLLAARLRRLCHPLGPGRVLFVLFLSCSMAVTHQISPYLAFAALGVLWLFGYVRPWWMPLVVLVPALAWALANVDVLGRFVSLGALGQLWQNVQPPTHSGTQLAVPAITRLAFDVPALVLFIVGVVAVVTLVRSRTRPSWALAAAALSPACLFLATNYGQEGIFRAALFAGPWLAILAVSTPLTRFSLPRFAPFRSRSIGVTTRFLPALLASVTIVLVFVNVYGQTALDWNRVVTADSALATQRFESTAPARSVLLLTGTGQATPLDITARYLDVSYVSRELFGGYPSTKEYDAGADVQNLTSELVGNITAPRYYALVSTSIGAYDERYGYQSFADYRKLAAAMAASPLWRVVFTGPTTTLYELKDAASVPAS
jgi:hypothetical protein